MNEEMRETLLIVEDEPLNRELLFDILSHEGYNVLQANDGAQALEIFKREGEKIHLLIIDMNLPGMDGKETIDAIRKIDRDVKIILTTGGEMGGRVSETVSSGVAAFIKKPYRINILTSTIREVLEG